MRAKGPDSIFRSTFVALILFFLYLFSGITGCSTKHSADQSVEITNMPEKDALEAGSMALYMQGLLCEGSINTTPDQATDAYSKALELNPRNQNALSALVNTLSQQKHYEEAFEALSKYLINFPESNDLHDYAVKLADHLQKPVAAAQYCQQILVNDPTNQTVAQAAIQYYFDGEKDKEALNLLRKFTEKLSNKEALKFSLKTIITIYQSRVTPKQALKCSNIALQFAKNNQEKSDVMMVKAYCQLEADQIKNALQTFKESYTLNPQNHIPLTHLGFIYANHPKMLRSLEKHSTNQTEETPPAQLILGYAYNSLEQPEKAAVVFEKYHRQRVRNGYFTDKEFYLMLGSTYELCKAYGKIDKLFADAICAFPEDPEILNFAAYLWSERGIKLDDALRLINTVLKQRPNNPAFLDTKGWVLHKMGRHFESLQILLKACAVENQEPIILDHTGDVLYSIGNEVLALDFWKKSYITDPQQSIANKLTKLGEPLPTR